MPILNGCGRTSRRLALLAVVLLAATAANAEPDPADIHTTTRFGPPMPFGAAGDGRIFAGDPLSGLEVVEVRVFWDIVVADGQDAADIFADVFLPIDTNTGLPATITLDGPVLGWSGSGEFHHEGTMHRLNGTFQQAPAGFGFQSWGLPPDAVDILPTSRIEIDYVAPEPSCAALLAIMGLALVRRRRQSKAGPHRSA